MNKMKKKIEKLIELCKRGVDIVVFSLRVN